MPQKRLQSDEVKFIMKMKEVKYSNREIARRLGISEGSVRYRLKREASGLSDKRSFRGSGIDRYKRFISEWIKGYMGDERRPTYKLLYRVLHDDFNFTGSYDSVRRYVFKYFPDFHKKPVWLRIQTPPGMLLFVDWKEDLKVQLGRSGNWVLLQALVFSLGFSGKLVVVYFDRKDLDCFISGHQKAFIKLGGLVKFIRPDCLKSAIKKWRGLNSEINTRYESYLNRFGIEVFPSRPGRATDKGKIEKRIRDFFSNIDFKHRVFTDMKDLQDYSDVLLESFEHEWRSSTTGLTVSESFSYEQEHLSPLPEHFPLLPVRERYIRVRRDCTVHFCNNYFQVERRYIGQTVLCMNTGDEILIYYNGEEINRYAYLPGSRGMMRLCEKVLRDPELKISDKVRQWGLEVSRRQVEIYHEISNGGFR
jgi:transposase